MATAQKKRPPNLSDKFATLRKAMSLRLVEREDEIEIFLLALAARCHAFLQGEPGTAKSFTIETGISLIDMTPDAPINPVNDEGDPLTADEVADLLEQMQRDAYFHALMMKSTTREDIFGPLMLSLLKQDRYVYKSEGFLPVAKVAFLDEAWKANAAILNALLWACNERLYRNDGKVLRIPLHSMFIASNEFPEGDELAAIYDRFILRKIVKPIVEPGNFIGMLKLDDAPDEKILTWSEVEEAHREVEAVIIPNDVLEALADVKNELKTKSIFPSDRRWKMSKLIIQAKAWLDGETQADIGHLRPLRHVLWSEPEHAPILDQVMTGRSNPIDLEIMDICAGLSEQSAELDRALADPADTLALSQTCSQIFDKVEIALEELNGISTRLKGSRRRTEKLSTARDQVLTLTERLLKKGFKMSEDDIAQHKLMEFSISDDEDERAGDDE